LKKREHEIEFTSFVFSLGKGEAAKRRSSTLREEPSGSDSNEKGETLERVSPSENIMTDRQKIILKTIIEEHIRTGDPVGSKSLFEKFDFGIGPAMIRQEMTLLEEEGYLSQPHVSAGRVPSDKAYRFYIAKELSLNPPALPAKEAEKISETLRHTKQRPAEFFHELAKVMAELSHELVVSGLLGRGQFFAHGFSERLAGPELADPEYIRELLTFIDASDAYFERLWSSAARERTKVLIGRDHAHGLSGKITLIAGRATLPSGEMGFFSILGPRRMNYRKNIALVEFVSDLMK
jgi:heat-inducible transcriptional repressor